ncbi:hypothetical protein [Subtercola lobariae]|uniref:Uncharacterized protein n=1 Tax=Subtercola lobariae TaxID=1588641 RepID=A0A917B6R5_9MICO|nr:hypothetical protein [Subtercola lobariae]GGF26458.1 hypothetical protein GCM10011399_19820 [Subtercola lobariae]
MHIITTAPSPVRLTWHLPEVEWHEATVELADTLAPSGARVESWHIDSSYDGMFAATWSSGRRRGDALTTVARIRVARHDGPCIVAVRLVDDLGEEFVSVISRNRR